jgi:AhpC/TSA family
MFARSLRLTPARILIAFAVLALVTLAISAAAPNITPAEGNAPKPVAGQVAPTFALVDQNGKKHQLADYKGKWVVVYFYPKDQTPGCTTQACNFTENVFAFRKANAQILGVSEDDEASHKDFEKALSPARLRSPSFRKRRRRTSPSTACPSRCWPMPATTRPRSTACCRRSRRPMAACSSPRATPS